MFIDLNPLGLIAISGTQSAEFLQGQMSCDVKEVTDQQSRLGLHCTPKGRVLGSFRLFYIKPNYYLLLPQSMVALLMQDLKKYAVFYKIKLEAATIFSDKIGIIDQDIPKILETYGCKLPMQANQVHYHHGNVILQIPGPQPRVILLTQAATAFDKKSFDAWEKLDIESGLASIYPSARALFTPHQLYYHQRQGISFTKGCYTGQEVIARMHYLGQLKNKLYNIALYCDLPPQAGGVLLDEQGQKQGSLIMATHTKNAMQYYQGLASIYDAAIGQALSLDQAPISILNVV